MRRKVIKIGPATLVVSLPADWAKKFNIKKGDELEIVETGRNMMISTGKESGTNKDKALINISKYNPLIMRTIGMLYKSGYKEIKIYYDNSKKNYLGEDYFEIDLIKRAVESYSGVDIEEIRKDKDGNYIQISERSNLLQNEFKKTLDQSFRHLCFLSEQVVSAFEKNNKNALKSIDMTDNLINQTTNFCQKLLNKRGYEEFDKTSFVYEIVSGIEKLGDKYRLLYKYFAKNNFKISGGLIKFCFEIDEFLNDFYSLNRKFEIERLSYIGNKGQLLLKKSDKLLESINKKEIKIMFYLYNITEEIYDLLEPLIGLHHEKIN
jgi:bifunctional DNA-binding transcriptional regulator/antitoxin component of YhaV-PrlF toxin-antitoxin module